MESCYTYITMHIINLSFFKWVILLQSHEKQLTCWVKHTNLIKENSADDFWLSVLKKNLNLNFIVGNLALNYGCFRLITEL